MLSKLGHNSNHDISFNLHALPSTLSIIWDQHNAHIPIDKSVRQICKAITHSQKLYHWLNHSTMTQIKTATYNQQINFELIAKYFNYNPYNHATSRFLTKFRAWQLKTSNNLLPTMDRLEHLYPKLIRNTINCWLCNAHIETNDHLWTCTRGLHTFIPHLHRYVAELIRFIREHCDQGDTFLEDNIKRNNIFA
ncbi:hypothetical protein RclHR1_22310002 [Rhizophagus clarus]|uniref:Ribonuclease H-like domain-containing protein n=1 Tax=Rhizophagus clarus TaxID=94130 RepID=A0A2Z6QUZ2_9GLOM|nr:hypothetical protein RclHR1_22310002 [Rhizophagus clarus]GES87317.1 ribonuclease H-like domain-containing protein [Rhizophagus clarus]